MRCWYPNGYDELATPKPRVDAARLLGREVLQVAAGGYHLCAVLRDSSAKCWGDNRLGQIGLPEKAQDHPSLVRALPPVSEVATGQSHTCAVSTAGAVYCWGDNSSGELGVGSGAGNDCKFNDWKPDWAARCSTKPVQVAGLTEVRHVVAGERHTCALRGDGTVWCWGRNEVGELGVAATSERACGGEECSPKPQQVAGLSGVTRLAAGESHTCALRASGDVWCWGLNELGQLGQPPKATQLGARASRAGSRVPLQVPGISAASALVAGAGRSCAKVGEAWSCWGDAGAGAFSKRQALSCTSEKRTYPCFTSPAPLDAFGDAGATTVALGADFVCIITREHEIQCRADDCRSTSDNLSCGPADVTRRIKLSVD